MGIDWVLHVENEQEVGFQDPKPKPPASLSSKKHKPQKG